MIPLARCTAGDCHALGAIDPCPGWDGIALAAIITRPATCGFMAGEKGALPHGYIIGSCNGEHTEAEIIHLAVAPPMRRRGIARALLATFIKAHARNICHLEVAEDNAAAIALYNSAGFTVVGRRKGYYARRNKDGGVRVDALRMRLCLDTGGQGI